MKLLFVDHSFHVKTRSSLFFRELLRQHHDVEDVYVDPDKPLVGVNEALKARGDVVVLWQMDYLAPVFLAHGLRTVVIPMFDGSGTLPDLHWLWASQASFINFSRRLSDRLSDLGCRSYLVKYFPKPCPEEDLAEFDRLRAFLWQRRPEHDINVRMVESVLGARIASLHVHDVPDDPNLSSVEYLRTEGLPFELTISKWFEDPSGYAEALAKTNVFICPRHGEGIGLAMLEAMSRGMLVLAPDYPVHDEYIANWLTGILFNLKHPGEVPIDLEQARQIGRLAWRAVDDGHKKWIAGIPRILDFVASTPQPKLKISVDSGDLALGLCRSYAAGVEAYVTYLHTHMNIGERFAGRKLTQRDKLGRSGDVVPSDAPARGVPEWLSQNKALPVDLASERYTLDGQFRMHGGVAWIVRHGASIEFRIDPTLGATNALRILYRSPIHAERELRLCIILNGWTIWNDTLAKTDGELVIDLPVEAMAAKNVLLLQADQMAYHSCGEFVSLGIQEISFC